MATLGDPEGSDIHELCSYTLTEANKFTREFVASEVSKAVAEVLKQCEARIADLEARLKSATGRPPANKTWREGMVVYAGEIASFDGNLFQARVDTGSRPGGDPEASVCVARAGRDGASVSVRGAWTAKDFLRPAGHRYAQRLLLYRCWAQSRPTSRRRRRLDDARRERAAGQDGQAGFDGAEGQQR